MHKEHVKKKNTSAEGKRKLTFSLSLSACIGIAVTTVMGFVWVFIFGLLVGRGYQPEEAVPELKHIMPSSAPSAHSTPAKQTDAQNKKSAESAPSAKRPRAKNRPEATTERQEQVLKAEELNFYDRLKKGDSPAPKPAQKKTTSTKAQQPAASNKAEETFKYVYQVAAFKERSAASRFVERLTQLGYTGRISSGQAGGMTWYRIQVLFTGTVAATRTLKQDLARIGVRKPLLKSKTATR